MRDGLAEADAGVEHHPLHLYARRHREAQALLEERLHILDHIVISRPTHPALHRARLAEHVHQAAVHAAVGDHRDHLRVGAQRADVVDDLDAGSDRGARDRRLGGVDRDLHVELRRGDPFEHRQHPAQLLVGGHRLSARPCGLATDVEDVSPLRDQLTRMRDRRPRIQELSPVRERVRGHVQDPHQAIRHAHRGKATDGWIGVPGKDAVSEVCE